MIEVSKEQIIKYHEDIINDTGGSNGLRDGGMLESALASAFQTFGGEYLYQSVTAKIARIAYGIIRNHPFVDGNNG
jgi:death-on-curing protein